MGHTVAREDVKLIRGRVKAKGWKNRLPLILAGVSLTLVLILSVIVGIMMAEQKEHKDNIQDENIQDTQEDTVRTEVTTSQRRTEDVNTAKTEASSDTNNSTEVTTQKQSTVITFPLLP